MIDIGPDGSARPTNGWKRRVSPVAERPGEGPLTLMSEVKGRGSALAFRLTAGRISNCNWLHTVEDELALDMHLQLAALVLEFPGVQSAMRRQTQIDAIVTD